MHNSSFVSAREQTLPPQRDESESPRLHFEQEQQRWRIWVVVGGFGLLASLVLLRLLDYQLAKWRSVEAAQLPVESVLPRGVIVDRRGEILAGDRFFYRLGIDAVSLKSAEERQALVAQLQDLTGLPAQALEAKLMQDAKRFDVELAKDLSLEIGQKLLAFMQHDKEENAARFSQYMHVDALPTRFYPQGSLASHVIGFVGGNRSGNYGVEAYYNSFVDPQSGIGLLQKTHDTLGQLDESVRRFIPSMGNKDLILTIDSGVQWILEDELQKAVTAYRATGGTIIVMEPHTGALLGIANWPNFDPNQYSKTLVDHFQDPAISLLYEPGSIFKLITMAAALDTNVITPTTMYTDSGAITVGGRVIFNSNRVGYGRVSVTEALARSLNVVTAQVAEQVGAEAFYRYIHRFGFGQLTEVDLAGEVPGLLKEPGNDLWSLSDLGTNSFGQGIAVTPIQMASAVSAIANGGYLMRPSVVSARVYHEEVLFTQPRVVRPVLKPKSVEDLTAMMVDTVRTGNVAASVAGYTIAGKSGTAQIPSKDGYEKDATITSFVGFAPADDPKIVILVKLDRPDPTISEWATHTAAPVFAQVARRLFTHLNIPPDAVRLGETEPEQQASGQ
jgi:cell division protein FtsI/penicillin-binding protein 2